jgi:hypothetical protein
MTPFPLPLLGKKLSMKAVAIPMIPLQNYMNDDVIHIILS